MSNIKIPLWFKIVAIVALLWNIMGLLAFVTDVMRTPEELEALDIPPAMKEAYRSSPTWNWIAYGLATVCGFLGSLMLVLRKKVALPLLGLSLLGVLVQFVGWYFIGDVISELEGAAMAMPIMVVIIAIYLYFLSHKSKRAGWIA